MFRGGVRTECAWPQEQGLRREAWVVICVQQRHHPHAKFKPAHRTGQSFCLHFNSTLTIPNESHNYNLHIEMVILSNNIVWYFIYLLILLEKWLRPFNIWGFMEWKLEHKLKLILWALSWPRVNLYCARVQFYFTSNSLTHHRNGSKPSLTHPVVHPGESAHCHTQHFTSFESVKSAHTLQRNVIWGMFCAAIYLHLLDDHYFDWCIHLSM